MKALRLSIGILLAVLSVSFFVSTLMHGLRAEEATSSEIARSHTQAGTMTVVLAVALLIGAVATWPPHVWPKLTAQDRELRQLRKLAKARDMEEEQQAELQRLRQRLDEGESSELDLPGNQRVE